MDFGDLDFFVSVCNSSFVQACSEYKLNKNSGMNRISEMEKYLGFGLFSFDENKNITMADLTSYGESFLCLAKQLVENMSGGILDICDFKTSSQELRILSPFHYEKNILLPVILSSQNSREFATKNLNLITNHNLNKMSVLNTHVILNELSKNDEIFFKKRWSAIVGQKLYASLEYISDVGGVPTDPNELFSHSIIAHGTFGKIDRANKFNWHISGMHGLPMLEPSLMVNSISIVAAAVESNLGIAPIVDCHDAKSIEKLQRVLPDIEGPKVVLDFAVRKKISVEMIDCIICLESLILQRLKELEVDVVHY